MRVAIESFVDSFFLDISPTNAESLHFVTGPPAYIDFRTKEVTLIAPTGLPKVTGAVTASEQDTFHRMCKTTKLTAARISLPVGAHLSSSLMEFCNAMNKGGLQPDVSHSDLKSLYRGKGGKILKDDDPLWPPSYISTTTPSPAHLLPAPTIAPNTHDDNLPPYPHPPSDSSPPPSPLSSSVPATKKRSRSLSPSFSTKPPRHRTSKNLDLVLEEKEAETRRILERVDNQQQKLLALLENLAAAEAAITVEYNKATLHLADVEKAKLGRPDACSGSHAEGQDTPRGCGSSETSTALLPSSVDEVLTAPASFSTPSVESGHLAGVQNARRPSQVSTASEVSTIPAFPDVPAAIQSYVLQMYHQMYNDMAKNYVTRGGLLRQMQQVYDRLEEINAGVSVQVNTVLEEHTGSVERRATIIVEGVLEDYVRETCMNTRIEDALDDFREEAHENLLERLRDTLSYF